MGLLNIFRKKGEGKDFKTIESEPTEKSASPVDTEYERKKAELREQQRAMRRAVIAKRDELSGMAERLNSTSSGICDTVNQIAGIKNEYEEMIRGKEEAAKEEEIAKAFVQWCNKNGKSYLSYTTDDYNQFLKEYNSKDNKPIEIGDMFGEDDREECDDSRTGDDEDNVLLL